MHRDTGGSGEGILANMGWWMIGLPSYGGVHHRSYGRVRSTIPGRCYNTPRMTLAGAHTLGLVWTGRRSRHGQAVHRGPHQFHVMTVGPVHRQAHRNALGGQQATLDPAFAAVSGVGAGFSPRPRAMAPSILSQLQAPSVRHRFRRQPIPESAGGRWTRSRCPWRPAPSTGASAQHVEDAIGAGAVRDPGPTAAETMGVHMLGDQRRQHLPELVGDLERAVVGLVLVAGPARFGRGGLASFALVIAPV